MASGNIFGRIESFLNCLDQFRAQGKPTGVEVAFHYTQELFLPSISLNGLVSDNKTRCNGHAFGRGIYVGTNPHAFSVYGEVGLLVLILKGTVRHLDTHASSFGHQVDTLLGNKLMQKSATSIDFPTSPYFDEIILQRDEQALPLFSFPSSLVNNAELMWDMQVQVQAMVDALLHGGVHTPVRRIYPSLRDVAVEHTIRVHVAARNASLKAPPQNWAMVVATAERRIACSHPDERFRRTDVYAPLTTPDASECPICMMPLNEQDPAVRLSKCGHPFHLPCLKLALAKSSRCPMCRVVTSEPAGTCPEGSMMIRRDAAIHCSGFEQCGTIVMNYDIPAGIQSKCHDHPGRPFGGTRRETYLPDHDAGQKLLKRLEYAFARGLLFTVGTSLTTGQSNVVVWSSVHQKTSRHPGPHGYPDDSFFVNCHDDLTALGVPKAEDL